MKISKLVLNHYRGAESLELELDPNLNIFAGVNGAGKSTVLDGIAIMLSWAVSRIKSSGASGRPIPEVDITNGYSSASIELSCTHTNRSIFWKLSKSRKGHSSQNDRSNLNNLSEFAKLIKTEITEQNEAVNLPLFLHYPVNRAVIDIPLRITKKQSNGLLNIYDDALTSGANFRAFFEWFREREDLENENRKYLTTRSETTDLHKSNLDRGLPMVEKSQILDPQLEAVRNSLQQFLPEFRNFNIRRNPLRMEVEKNGQKLTVNQLSDGEKCLIALVGDLARRMAIANTMRENPLEGDGIVLIDEIDLHLHPKWQRTVVSKLTKIFPNCQFIISTHSPHVINHVKPEHVFLLTRTPTAILATHPSKSYGNNADRILEDLMGLETTRPDYVFAELGTIYEYISQNLLADATKKITALKQEIGADPELLKAEVLIKRKELIGK